MACFQRTVCVKEMLLLLIEVFFHRVFELFEHLYQLLKERVLRENQLKMFPRVFSQRMNITEVNVSAD